MFLDWLLRVANSWAITASAVSPSSVDLGAPGARDIFIGEPVCAVLSVEVAAVGTGTYTFSVIESDAAALTSPRTLASRTIAAAALTAGSLHYIDIEAGVGTGRYIGLEATTGGTSPGITVSAHFQPRSMIQAAQYPRSGITIA
jgi:hypothetical protein